MSAAFRIVDGRTMHPSIRDETRRFARNNSMNIRNQMETLGAEGPIEPAPALATDSVLPPVPRVAVVRL